MDVIVILIIICALVTENAGSGNLCPLWYRYNESTGKCECVSDLSGAIICKKQGQVYLRIEYCMTLDHHSNVSVAGVCHRGHYNRHHMINGAYGLLPNDSSKLEEVQCKPNKRRGLQCGKCMDGYGVSVTSLNPKCIECKFSPLAAVLIYLAVELIPITAFFLVIVIFRINIMVGPLLGYFIFCQAYAAAANQLNELYISLLSHADPFMTNLLYISYTLSSMWALCSFNILQPICISPRISLIDAIAMKYIRVVYPLLLVPITYFLIELHARNFKPVVCIWRPFKICLTKINVTISANDSVIHAYATLYSLSFAVLNYISYRLLNLTNLVREDGIVRHTRLLVDPTVEGYSFEHAPYAAMSFAALLFFGIIPGIILCLYPIGMFRNALECIISHRKRIILNTFAETLYASLKNGLNGTRDCRSLLGIFMLLTILLLSLNAHSTAYYNLTSYIVTGCTLILIALIVAYIRPFNTFLGNLSFSFHATVSSLICIQITIWLQHIIPTNTTAMVNLFAVLNILPHVLIALWIGYKAFSTIIHQMTARGFTSWRATGYAPLPQH